MRIGLPTIRQQPAGRSPLLRILQPLRLIDRFCQSPSEPGALLRHISAGHGEKCIRGKLKNLLVSLKRLLPLLRPFKSRRLHPQAFDQGQFLFFSDQAFRLLDLPCPDANPPQRLEGLFGRDEIPTLERRQQSVHRLCESRLIDTGLDTLQQLPCRLVIIDGKRCLEQVGGIFEIAAPFKRQGPLIQIEQCRCRFGRLQACPGLLARRFDHQGLPELHGGLSRLVCPQKILSCLQSRTQALLPRIDQGLQIFCCTLVECARC